MKVVVLLLVLFLSVIGQDPNACAQWPTCEICLTHNSCGWCAENVVYEDGSQGPHCAGKPIDPEHPPPGFKKWTCPKDYQNKACFGYVCDNTTFQCISSGAPGMGVPLDQCLQSCFPPTYLCNTTDYTCQRSKPGTGTDLKTCEAQCQDDLYVCNKDGECEQNPNGGGLPKDQCLTSCKPSNVTPVVIIGDYRGLQINQNYMKGEWQAKINETGITIWKPDGSVWAMGVVQTFQAQLWIQTATGLFKGIFALDNTPEVGVLTWALGPMGQEAPPDFDTAMRGDTVFVLGKCLNAAVCKFNVHNSLLTDRLPVKKENPIVLERKRQAIEDPCMKYPDCQSCVDAPFYCGWCSVPVMYNGTIPGKNCAGVNRTITKFSINCTGSFSIESCTFPTSTGTGSGTTATSSTAASSGSGTATATATASTTGTASTGTTGGQIMFACSPENGTCYQSPNGTLPKEVCTAECTVTPVVPPVLVNKEFRGLAIELNYMMGEFTAKFTNSTVTITPPIGPVMTGKVTSTSNYLTVFFQDGSVVQSLWQIAGGPAADYFSWAWGKANGPPPANFDEAMTTQGEREFWMVSCPNGKPTNVCQWKF